MNQRQKAILDLLGGQRTLGVAWLAQHLDTSQVTVRKDLDLLAADGYVQRRHGTVTAAGTDDLAGRLPVGYNKKLAIATLAAQMVNDGDTVLIESGSTCAILAKLLCEQKKDLTLVTNSLFIADFVGCGARVVLCGGELQPRSRALVGPLTALALGRFFGKFLFCGIDGMDPQAGFTLSDQARAETVRTMAGRADQTFVLTTSDKFSARGSALQLAFSAVTGIFTDEEITPSQLKVLRQKNLNVITPKEREQL